MDEITLDRLITRATAAADNAYVPYSSFPIGAALITKNGHIFTGCNVENMSFGLTVCAERVAILKAVSEGHTDIHAIVIYHPGTELAYPCGACRQMLAEFNKRCEVAVVCDDKSEFFSLNELLPFAFESENL